MLTERIFERHIDVSRTFNERPTDVDCITFWTLEVCKLNVKPDVQWTLNERMCDQWDHTCILNKLSLNSKVKKEKSESTDVHSSYVCLEREREIGENIS